MQHFGNILETFWKHFRNIFMRFFSHLQHFATFFTYYFRKKRQEKRKNPRGLTNEQNHSLFKFQGSVQ